MKKKWTQLALIMVLALLPVLVSSSPAMAISSYMTAFTTQYPSSTTGTTAWSATGNRCNVCHSTGGGTDLNPYGKDWAAQHNAGATPAAAFVAIEGMNSDGDAGGATNIQEITAGSQPGYTTGSTQLYDIFALTASTVLTGLPTGLVGPLDPAATVSPPVANAGPAQAVTVGATVMLDGTASSDPGGKSLTYSWSFVSRPTGSAATLTNATTVHPTFVADAAGSYTVQLIVNNGTTNSAPATVVITAAPAAILPPVANAGAAQTVTVGQTVTLSGSGSSDPQSLPLTYSWSFVSRPAGSAATLTGATTVGPTFVADVAGTFTVQLIVNNGTLNSTPATVSITTSSVANRPPVANAGPNQTVNVGATVTLDGSLSSDPDGNTLTYSWSFVSTPAGSAATLTGATTVHPTFVADAAGQYVVQLIVNDGTVNSAPATVVIGASVVNQPPTANAGPAQTVDVGATVTLDGSLSSDPNANPLTYSWSFVSRPAGSAATLTGATTVHPTFVADAAGQYVVQLIVNDGTVNSAPATVVITANPAATNPPGAATLISPTGNITTTTPTYTWNAVATSTWYLLWVNDTSGSGKIRQWYTAAQANCASGTGTCSVTPATALATGAGSWWIQTWNSAGYGPWSAALSFTVTSSTPTGGGDGDGDGETEKD